jgi:asparagine synthase (glutamine-hydrolysing)
MSGIVGIFNLDGKPINRELLTSMTEFLSFRGSDENRIWVKDNIGFGHALLKTDEGENVPLPLTRDGQTWLTAHARIDGRQELVEALAQHFLQLQTKPAELTQDGNLILMAYQIWGENCVEHLIGDFSFAIWDSGRRRLFCARDQMSVGQFYYAHVNGAFLFSNTLDCLRLHPDISTKLNDVAVGDFLLFGLNQEPETSIFADIQRLPRAHSLLVTSEGIRAHEYWVPSSKAVRYHSSSEYVEKFRELLEHAVSDRLRSTRVSIALSGGLDSSIVAATAGGILKKSFSSAELKGYCVVYGRAFPDDEKKYASEVASAVGSSIEFLEADLINQEINPRTWGYAPEPFDVEPFYVVSDELLRRMSSTSRVGLTGWDGDTFMTESPKHLFYELWRTRRFGQLFREMSSYIYSQHSLPPIGIRTWWQRRSGHVKRPPYPIWINEDFEKRLKLTERWQDKTAEAPPAHATRPYAFSNLNTPHWDALFARFDPGKTRLPLEVRHPLIDLRLVDYLLSVPVIPWLLGKHILRESLHGLVPESIRTRCKTPLAGDPGLQLRYSTKVKRIDSFLPNPDVLNYIKREAVPLLSTETDSASLWVNVRPFSLNQWLVNSKKLENKFIVEHQDEGHREYSQTRAPRSAQTALQ